MREMPAQTEQLIAHCACHLAHENFDKIALPRDGKYRVNCIGIEIVVEASSHFGAAFKTAVVLHQKELMINNKSVTVYQSNGGIFEYLMRIVSKDGKAYPHVTLTRMQILDQQENSKNIFEILTSAASTDHICSGLNLNEMSSACELVDSALRSYFGFASFRPQQ